MSYGGLLNQIAHVYRRPLEDAPEDELEERTDRFGQRQVEDRFGQPVQASVLVGSYPCRSNRPSGGETMQERAHDVAEITQRVYFNADADLREDDEITIVSRYGRRVVTMANVKLVKHVEDGQGVLHHIEVDITSQRPSGGLSETEAVSG